MPKGHSVVHLVQLNIQIMGGRQHSSPNQCEYRHVRGGKCHPDKSKCRRGKARCQAHRFGRIKSEQKEQAGYTLAGQYHKQLGKHYNPPMTMHRPIQPTV